MQNIFINKKKITNILIVFCIVLLSVIYSTGGGLKVLNVFLNNQREIPIYCVETGKKDIALTFDVALGAEYTEEILNILDKNNIKATFFVVGNWVDRHGDILKKINDKGHEIGNHSTTHPHFTQLSPQRIKEEVYITSDKIKTITGKDTILFRPPFGDYNSQTVKTVKEAGYFCIQWDVDSLDWKKPGEEFIYERVVSKTRNGSILLFHNYAEQTPKVLDKIIKSLKKEGFNFIWVSDLIYKDNYYIDHTGMQRAIKK